MKRKRLLLLLTPLIMLDACKKDNNEKQAFDGSYTGSVVIAPLSAPNASGTNYVYSVAFSMQAGEFTSEKTATTIYLGSGTYQTGNQNITFTNTAVMPTPINNNFPSSPWLNGTFTYSTKGDSVFFVLPVVPGNSSNTGIGYTVTYKLKRN